MSVAGVTVTAACGAVCHCLPGQNQTMMMMTVVRIAVMRRVYSSDLMKRGRGRRGGWFSREMIGVWMLKRRII